MAKERRFPAAVYAHGIEHVPFTSEGHCCMLSWCYTVVPLSNVWESWSKLARVKFPDNYGRVVKLVDIEVREARLRAVNYLIHTKKPEFDKLKGYVDPYPTEVLDMDHLLEYGPYRLSEGKLVRYRHRTRWSNICGGLTDEW